MQPVNALSGYGLTDCASKETETNDHKDDVNISYEDLRKQLLIQKTAFVRCPICRSSIRYSYIDSHVRHSHFNLNFKQDTANKKRIALPAKRLKKDSAPAVIRSKYTICQYCNCKVKSDRIDKHINNTHGLQKKRVASHELQQIAIDRVAARVMGKSKYSGPTPNELRSKAESGRLNPHQRNLLMEEAKRIEKRDKRLLLRSKAIKKAERALKISIWKRENDKSI